MKIPNTSFRLKLTLSLFLVVFVISFINFYYFNRALGKIIIEDQQGTTISVLNVLKDQFYFNLNNTEENDVGCFIHRVTRNKRVTKSYLLNNEGKVMCPDSLSSFDINDLGMGDTTIIEKDFEFLNIEQNDTHFSRAFIKMNNSPECYKCHSPDEEVIGFLVLDFAMEGSHKAISFSHSYSIFFTLFLVLVIIGLIILMHYRIVKRSLSMFSKSMMKINQGDLDERIEIPESKELGKLAQCFNSMVETFQNTQKELMEYHEKESENKYKMATIGEMTARLAHEIRNPLTGISNAIEILVKKMEKEKNRIVLEEISRQVERVNNALSNMLRFSSETKINREFGNINEIVKAVHFFIKNQTSNKNINFSLQLQEQIPNFEFDKQKTEDVILNLSLNAINAIPKSGSITFKTLFYPQKKEVLISVADTGIGIPESDLKRVFTPFYTTRTEGVGLGLAIAREVILKQGGNIWVESVEGRGSTFFVSLPTSK